MNNGRDSAMNIEQSKTYVFEKSGNLVRAIAPSAPHRGMAMWEVERVAGQSAGKRMQVPARSLSVPTA